MYADNCPGLEITNTIVGANHSTTAGGICLIGSSCNLSNITFFAEFGALQKEAGSTAEGIHPLSYRLHFWQNTAASGLQIFLETGSNAIIEYSDVEAGWGGTGTSTMIRNSRLPMWEISTCASARRASDTGSNAAPGIPALDCEGDDWIVDGDLDYSYGRHGRNRVAPGSVGTGLGTVNGSSASLGKVLKINGKTGDEKRICYAVPGQVITVTMDASPAGPSLSPYALYIILEEAGVDDLTDQPFGFGTACMQLPLGTGSPSPPPFCLVNNIGFNNALGFPVLNGIPAAPSTVLACPCRPDHTPSRDISSIWALQARRDWP